MTNFCHFGQITVKSLIFNQLFVTLDTFLSILSIFYQTLETFYHLSRVDLDMFMSIQILFPCSDIDPKSYWHAMMTYMLPSVCLINHLRIFGKKTFVGMQSSKKRSLFVVEKGPIYC